MAFYGRITNESKTSMTFDRVYPNRLTMNAYANEDGVFNGRFVLVEYDSTTQGEASVVFDASRYPNGQWPYDKPLADAQSDYNNLLEQELEPYNLNYNIDKIVYARLGRGYDGTVWRKVVGTTEGGEPYGYYVMLAELNSVVPTFGITPLAPSDEPTKPTFGKDSSNIYYDLELGSLWGMKLNDSNVNINKEGFNRSERHIDGTPAGNQGFEWTTEKSGNTYQNGEMADDIKVLNINLPIIGDMVATGWDMIYGEDRDTSPVVWYDGQDWQEHPGQQLVENGEYHWGATINGATVPNGSIADAIRSTYDLAGMIIQPITYTEFENLTMPIPEDIMEPGYIYYIIPNENPTPEEEALINEYGRFYYLGYKYGFSDDYFVSESDEGFVKGQKATEVLNPLSELPEDTSYIQLAPNDYMKASVAKSDQPYYQLDLSIFEGKEPIDYLHSNADELISQGKLYKHLISELNTITLTQVVSTDELNNSDYVYYVLDPDEINTVYQAAIFRDKTSSGYDIFYSANGSAYSVTDFRTLNDNATLYYKISSDMQEIVDPETGHTEYEYTEVFKPLGIKSEALADCVFGPTNNIGEKKICAWPSNNMNWDPSDENFETNAAKCYWIKKENNGVISLVLQNSPPPLSKNYPETIGEEGKNTAFAIIGNLPCGSGYGDQDERIGGHDDNGIKGLCTITNVEVQYVFPQGGETYWVRNGDHIYYVDEDTIIPDNDKECVYDLESDDIDLRVSTTPIAGINGAKMYNDPEDDTPYYFVPNELYVYDGTTQTYTQAEEFEEGADYYTLSRASVKYDFTTPDRPFSQFREGESWNPNLNLDDINRTKVSVQAILDSGFDLPFDENTTYYADANGSAALDPAPSASNYETLFIDPVVVSYEVKDLAFFPMERYAKNLNTVNGMIVMLNRLMGDANDKTTRDTSTVQGMLNTLEDKLSKLADVPGDSLVVTDQYGHLNGATITDQNATGQDRAIITDPIGQDEISGLEPQQPDIYKPATNQIAYWDKSRQSYVEVVAPITGPDSWLTADVVTGTDGKAYAYILHNKVDIDTTPTMTWNWADGTVSTLTLPAIDYDGAGHVIGSHLNEYTFPSGFNGDTWINVSTNTTSNTLDFTHTATGSFQGGDTGVARTATFGSSFNAMAIGTDEAGHINSLSTVAITLPTISFSADAANDDSSAITGLTVDNTGAITVSRTPIVSLTLSTWSTVATTTATSDIDDSDSLADALKKLENRMAIVEGSAAAAVGALDSTAICTDIGGITLTMTQSAGTLSTFTASVDWSTVAGNTGTATLDASTWTGFPPSAGDLSIIDAINNLQAQITNMGAQASAYTYSNNAYIFRQSTAPVPADAPGNLNAIYSGWIWIKTSSDGTESLNNEVYFCTTTTTGAVNWELLNSWR